MHKLNNLNELQVYKEKKNDRLMILMRRIFRY